MNILAILGWALAMAATFTAMPQLVHLAKGNRVGIEPLTPAIASVTMVSWIIFTAAKRDLPAFASSLGPLIIWAITLALLIQVPLFIAITYYSWESKNKKMSKIVIDNIDKPLG